MDEFKVRAGPSNGGIKFNVFKLHKDDNVSWAEAKMRRENDFQPWQIKFGSGKAGRRFKAIKEGGVGENASYFIFYKAKDSTDTYEVCPVEEWYNMSATQRYKTLTAEEAELKFEQRNKTFNMFTVMHTKKNGENNEDGMLRQDSKAFKVSELDEWDRSGDDLDDSDKGDDSDSEQKKQRKKKNVKKEKDEEDAPDEGKEESDEGDFEQREVDYMSDTSSESSLSDGEQRDENDVKGIAEEDALRDLLNTDDEEDNVAPQQKSSKFTDDRNFLGTVDIKHASDNDGSEDSSDSDDYDVDDDKMDTMLSKNSLPAQLVKQEPKQDHYQNNGLNSQTTSGGHASTPGTNQKGTVAAAGRRRQAPDAAGSSSSQPALKRPCTTDSPTAGPSTSAAQQSRPPVPSSTLTTSSGPERVVEELIKKYLSRKPMTAKNLLREVKSKLRRLGETSFDNDKDLVNTIAAIMLHRIKPDREKINDILYYSWKGA